MTHSDAAKEYASSRWQDGTIGWFEAAGDFDAGAAYDAPPLKAWERAMLGAAPAPVLLTADDPRIKDGARIQTSDEYTVGDSRMQVRHVVARIDDGIAVYLLAETPDDDEPILDALRVGGFVADQLASLRAAGYDVVKRA